MIGRALAASMFLILAGGGTAIADDDCRVPMNQWQPRDAVQQMAEARGWRVDRIRIDDGCYEIRGLDEAGRRIKAKVDPGSLAIVRIRHADRDRGRAESRQERAAPAQPATPPAPNPLLGDGAPPRAQVR